MPAAARRGARCASWATRPDCALLLAIDFIYWMAFAVYQTTFALFGARRFGFDATQTGYLLSAFGFLGVIVQGGLVGADREEARQRADARSIGLIFAAIGWGGSALTHAVRCSSRCWCRRDRHRPVQCDADVARQQAAAPARAGPRAGRRRRAREPRAHDRPGLGQRRAAGVRRRRRLRRGRGPAGRRRRHGRAVSPAGEDGAGELANSQLPTPSRAARSLSSSTTVTRPSIAVQLDGPAVDWELEAGS